MPHGINGLAGQFRRVFVKCGEMAEVARESLPSSVGFCRVMSCILCNRLARIRRIAGDISGLWRQCGSGDSAATVEQSPVALGRALVGPIHKSARRFLLGDLL